jgi:ribosome maturation factor RimP
LANVYLDIPEEMLSMIEPIVAEHGLELVDVERHQGRPPWTVRVIVDTREADGRVPIDRCAALSREIGAHFDAHDSFPVAYRLEVSSPGLDRVLAREKDFAAAAGREVKLETRAPINGRRRFRGRLLGLEGGALQLEVDGVVHRIALADVARANAVYTFGREDFAKGTGSAGR